MKPIQRLALAPAPAAAPAGFSDPDDCLLEFQFPPLFPLRTLTQVMLMYGSHSPSHLPTFSIYLKKLHISQARTPSSPHELTLHRHSCN